MRRVARILKPRGKLYIRQHDLYTSSGLEPVTLELLNSLNLRGLSNTHLGENVVSGWLMLIKEPALPPLRDTSENQPVNQHCSPERTFYTGLSPLPCPIPAPSPIQRDFTSTRPEEMVARAIADVPIPVD